MKPDWKDAPEDAMWLVQEECGSWWWSTDEPKLSEIGRCWIADGWWTLHCRGKETLDWRESKEQRP